MLGVIDGEAAIGNARRYVAMIRFGRLAVFAEFDRLPFLLRGVLLVKRPPTVFALIQHASVHADIQRIDAATRFLPANRVYTDDLADDGPRKLHTQPAPWAGAVPHTEYETVRSVLEQRSRVRCRQPVKLLADFGVAEL